MIRIRKISIMYWLARMRAIRSIIWLKLCWRRIKFARKLIWRIRRLKFRSILWIIKSLCNKRKRSLRIYWNSIIRNKIKAVRKFSRIWLEWKIFSWKMISADSLHTPIVRKGRRKLLLWIAISRLIMNELLYIFLKK